MRNIVITFGIISLCSLILLQMGKVALIKNSVPIEVLLGAFAGIFLFAGILISRRQPNLAETHVLQNETVHDDWEGNEPTHEYSGIDHQKINTLGISKREYEVLCEIAQGLSNGEIAAKMFVSESTIKTHTSNLLVKLDAKRRTEAVRIAKELNII